MGFGGDQALTQGDMELIGNEVGLNALTSGTGYLQSGPQDYPQFTAQDYLCALYIKHSLKWGIIAWVGRACALAVWTEPAWPPRGGAGAG